MRLFLVTVILCATLMHCARGGFGAKSFSPADAGGGDSFAGIDADSGAVDPLAPFGETTPISALNSAEEEDDPSLSSDELTIYFERAGNIWRATRDDSSAPWDPPEPVAELSYEGASDQDPTLSPDGRTLYLASDRPDSLAQGGHDIFVATRLAPSESWGAPVLVPELSSPAEDLPGCLSADGLRLYMATDRDSPSPNLYLATRSSLTAAWDPPAPLPVVSAFSTDRRPWVNGAETAIYFGSNRSGGVGGSDIWVAVRADPGQDFGVPVLLGGINTADNEEEAWLSLDERTIYFVSNRSGIEDLFVAHR